MKKIMLFVLSIVAIPFSVFAALDKFPTTPEEVLEHHLENSDLLGVSIQVFEPGTYDPFGSARYWFRGYLKEDGTSESINALARRSRTKLEALFQRILREAVRVNVDVNDQTLAGKKLHLVYDLWKDIRSFSVFSEVTMIGGFKEISSLTLGSDGKIVIPDEIFSVDLLEDTMKRSGIPFFVSGILSAELTIENETGDILERYASVDWDWPYVGTHPFVRSEKDVLSIPTGYFTDPTLKRGQLKVVLRGGTEQTFDRSSGKLFETVMPDLRPVRIERYGEGGFLLTVSSVEEGKELVVDFAPSVPARWEALPTAVLANAKVTKASSGETAILLDREGLGHIGFFRARVVPSSIRIR